MIWLPMSNMSHLNFFINHIFSCLTNIFQETKLSHVCHISVDRAICHFCQLWTAYPEPFVPSHSHHPQLLSAAATVTATAGTTATVVHNRSCSPSVRPAASHSTAAISCHRSQLLCAISASTTAAIVHNRSRSPSVHSVTSHSTAAVRCHRPQLLCTIAAATAAAVVPQPPSTATVHSCCAPLLPQSWWRRPPKASSHCLSLTAVMGCCSTTTVFRLSWLLFCHRCSRTTACPKRLASGWNWRVSGDRKM